MPFPSVTDATLAVLKECLMMMMMMMNKRKSKLAVEKQRKKLNSTQLTTPKEWFTRGKKLLEAYINPRFLSKQSRCFLKVATVTQFINDTGKLFHTSIILTVKKNFLTSKFTCRSWRCRRHIYIYTHPMFV